MIGEVAVDPRPAAVDVDLAGRLPPGGVGVATRVAAFQDQQIGERVGAGGPAVSAGRQPHGAEQLAEPMDRPARCRVVGVHRVVAGEHGHQAALTGQREGLDDEVVVQAQAAGVVPRVVQPHVGERDVPDRGVEVAVGQRRLRERLGADRGVGMDLLRDPGGGRVKLDTGQLGAGGREPDERTAAAPGSSTRPPLNPRSVSVCHITCAIAGLV